MTDAKPIILIFVDVTTLDIKEVSEILSVRNQLSVRRNMYNSDTISYEDHKKWVEDLKFSDTSKFYAVKNDGKIVGGAGVSAINRTHKRADWAFYLSEDTQGKGVGSALERQFINFLFSEFEIEKLNCEVIEFNSKVVSLHERFGFIVEGVRRNHVIRDGVKYDTILLGITKSEWEMRQ